MSDHNTDDEMPTNVVPEPDQTAVKVAVANFVPEFSPPFGPPPPRPRRPSFYLNPSLAPSEAFMSQQDARRLIVNYNLARRSEAQSSSERFKAQSSSNLSRSRIPAPNSPRARRRVHLPATNPTNNLDSRSAMATGEQSMKGEGKSGHENQPKTPIPVQRGQPQNLTDYGYNGESSTNPQPNIRLRQTPSVVFNPTPKLPDLGTSGYQTLVKNQGHAQAVEPPKSHWSTDSESDHEAASPVQQITSTLSKLGTEVKKIRQEMETTVREWSDHRTPPSGTWRDYSKDRQPPAGSSGPNLGFQPPLTTPTKDPSHAEIKATSSTGSSGPNLMTTPHPVTPTKTPRLKEIKTPKLKISPVITVVSTAPIDAPTPSQVNVQSVVVHRVTPTQTQSESTGRGTVAESQGSWSLNQRHKDKITKVRKSSGKEK